MNNIVWDENESIRTEGIKRIASISRIKNIKQIRKN